MTNIVRVTAHYSNHKSIHIQVTIASIESKTSSNEMSLNESKNYSLQNITNYIQYVIRLLNLRQKDRSPLFN